MYSEENKSTQLFIMGSRIDPCGIPKGNLYLPMTPVSPADIKADISIATGHVKKSSPNCEI